MTQQDDGFVPYPDHGDEDYETHKAIQKDQQQPQDSAKPFSEPRDAVDEFPDTHQLHDSKSNIDEHEAYDEGIDQAALDLPAANLDPTDATVADYHPPDESEET